MAIMQALMGSYGKPPGDPYWNDVMLLMAGSSSTADQSSRGNDPDSIVGTVNVTYTTGPYQTPQYVLDFTSTSDKRILFPVVDDLRIPAYGSGVAWTLETWFKTSDTGSEQRMFGIGNNVGNWDGQSGGELELSVLANGKAAIRIVGTNWITSTTLVDDNDWHHVAAVYNGSALRLYVDGTREGDIRTFVIYPNSNGTTQIRLGDGYLPSQQGFYDYRGYMADFRITKGVNRYTGPSFTPNTSPFPQSS